MDLTADVWGSDGVNAEAGWAIAEEFIRANIDRRAANAAKAVAEARRVLSSFAQTRKPRKAAARLSGASWIAAAD